MTLDEAIKHCEEKAAKLREYSDVLSETSTTPKGKEISDCLECAEEHEQLAEWLKELKDYREGKITCEFCKYADRCGDELPCLVCRCNHPNKFEPKTRIQPKDDDETWKEDMQRDADAYLASQEGEE